MYIEGNKNRTIYIVKKGLYRKRNMYIGKREPFK